MKPVIQIKNFSKRFGKKAVIQDISLDISSGETLGIVGMSGSGKTTLLNAIIGFIRPDEGEILFNMGGSFRSIHSSPLEINRKFGFASQQASVYPKLSVEENLDHFGSLYDLPKKERSGRIEQLLDLTHLRDSRTRLAQNLSGGMQKRLSIACALMHDPEILILDEPTSDLDPILRKQTWELIKRVNRHGTTVIIASHFLDELEHGCTRIAILHNAGIIAIGTPDQLKSLYTKNYEIHLQTLQHNYGAIRQHLSSEHLGISKIIEAEHKLTLYTSQPELALSSVLHALQQSGQSLLDVDVNRPSLDEVFETLTK